MTVQAPVGGLVLSVVSHGHGAQVEHLLHALVRLRSPVLVRVVLTQNCPEPTPVAPAGGWPFAFELRSNREPLGFGANHNRALAGALEAWVGVLNPDVQWEAGDPFAAMVTAAVPGVGCVYPVQTDRLGRVQDSERELPSPRNLWRRHVGRRVETRVDWVNAACCVFPRAAWESVGGFDERYFMYCEDVDLCLRLRLCGWSLSRAAATVIHDGQRASRRDWRHLRWHVLSLLRLWRSPAYRAVHRGWNMP